MIVQLLRQRIRLSVVELTEELGSSPATVRRDLEYLSSRGLVRRVHGGAELPSGSQVERDFELRESEELEAKEAIGQVALAELGDRETIFVDSSTTTLQLARALARRPVYSTVVTNSFAVARELLNCTRVEVVFVGGQFRREGLDFVGPLTMSALANLRFDKAFVGASAVNLDMGFTTADGREAELTREVLARARSRIVLVDATKFGRTSLMQIGMPDSSFTVVSDERLAGQDWVSWLEDFGAQVRLATLGETVDGRKLWR